METINNNDTSEECETVLEKVSMEEIEATKKSELVDKVMEIILKIK